MKPALLAVFVFFIAALSSVAQGTSDITNGMLRADVVTLLGIPRGAVADKSGEVLLFTDGTVTLPLYQWPF